MSAYTRFFKDLTKKDVGIAGGKGASLGEMTQAKIPVPNGFVILSESFEAFLKETDLQVKIDAILSSVNHKEMQSIENASEKIKALILHANIPKGIEDRIHKDFVTLGAQYVAVRSSATSEDSASAAWAGQLDSFLNTTKKDLLEKVKQCWASLFTPRAIFYRFEKGLFSTKISVAVVVQKMVNSEISGIAFSVHPVTQDRNQLIIEAGLGLGESIVSGQITPDSYVVAKNPRKIIDSTISNQERGLFRIEGGGNEWKSTVPLGSTQKLSMNQILFLSEIILRIENQYGFPCDIEWAYEGGKFFIVQSRPITTLSQEKSAAINSTSLSSSIEALSQSLSNEFFKVPLIPQRFPGFPIYPCYAAESMREMQRELGFSYTHFRIAHFDAADELMYFGDEIETVVAKVLEKYAVNRKYFVQMKKKYAQTFAKTTRALTTAKKKPITSVTTSELVQRFSCAHDLVAHSVGCAHLIEAIAFTQTHTLKDSLAKKIKDLKELSSVLNVLTTPSTMSFIAEYNAEVFDALNEKNQALQKKRIQRICKKYFWIQNSPVGCRVLLEKDIFEQQSSSQKNALRDARDIRVQKERVVKKYVLTKTEQDIANILSFCAVWQDERKRNMLIAFGELALILEEMGRRANLSHDALALFTPHEIKNLKYLEPQALEEIKARKEFCLFLFNKNWDEQYKVFSGLRAKEAFTKLTTSQKITSLSVSGMCASTGKAIGQAQICKNISDIRAFVQGNVLVASMTRPEYLPAMKKAVAIVTDEGGLTSHAAIIARELGIPCVIGTKIATEVFSNGDVLEVKANHGQVNVVEQNSAAVPQKGSIGEEFDKENFYLTGSAESVPLFYYTCSIGAALNAKALFVVINANGVSKWFIDKKASESLMQQWVHKSKIKITKDFALWKKKWGREEKKLFLVATQPPKDERVAWEQLDALGSRFWAESYFLDTLDPFADEIEKEITTQLTKKRMNPELVHDLISTPIPTRTQKAALDFEEVNKKRLSVAEYVRTYWYFKGSWVGGPVLTPELLIPNFLPTPVFVDYMARVAEQKKILRKLPQKTQALVHVLQTFALWREERKVVMQMMSVCYTALAQRIAKKEGVEFKDLVWVRPEEIKALKKDPTFARERQNKSVFIISPRYNPPVVLVKDAAQKVLDVFAPKKQELFVRGTIAYKGKVVGRARIVLKEHHFGKFQQGEILVTTSTRPEFVPLMGMAIAIVADEGGLTSHAAIVSRELKKPCVVGTKHATSIFTDGDLIEVDATTGVVRKIQ